MIAVMGSAVIAAELKERGLDAVADATLAQLIAAVTANEPLLVVLQDVDGTPEELDTLGQRIAELASAATAPTLVIVDRSQPVLWQSLRNWIYPPSLLVEVNRLEVDVVIAEAGRLA